jgi:hypothetical protein
LFESFRVILTEEVATLLARTGPVAVIEELATTAEPLWKITMPPLELNGDVMLNVLVSATMEARVHDDCPDPEEEEQVP